MFDITNLASHFAEVGKYLAAEVARKDEKIVSLEAHVARLTEIEHAFSTTCAEKDACITTLGEHVSRLEKEVRKLQDDNAAFSKVSHIIAMEKENARLRAEIAALAKQLSTTSAGKQSPKAEIKQKSESVGMVPVHHPIASSIILCDHQEKESTNPIECEEPSNVATRDGEIACETQEEETFITKKIKGVTYYISEKDMGIYQMMNNGDVGCKLGVLEKKNDKTKAIWN